MTSALSSLQVDIYNKMAFNDRVGQHINTRLMWYNILYALNTDVHNFEILNSFIINIITKHINVYIPGLLASVLQAPLQINMYSVIDTGICL